MTPQHTHPPKKENVWNVLLLVNASGIPFAQLWDFHGFRFFFCWVPVFTEDHACRRKKNCSRGDGGGTHHARFSLTLTWSPARDRFPSFTKEIFAWSWISMCEIVNETDCAQYFAYLPILNSYQGSSCPDMVNSICIQQNCGGEKVRVNELPCDLRHQIPALGWVGPNEQDHDPFHHTAAFRVRLHKIGVGWGTYTLHSENPRKILFYSIHWEAVKVQTSWQPNLRPFTFACTKFAHSVSLWGFR